MPFVLVQNDDSVYGDVTGVVYEYPRMYSPIPGERFIYYKGRESGGGRAISVQGSLVMSTRAVHLISSK